MNLKRRLTPTGQLLVDLTVDLVVPQVKLLVDLTVDLVVPQKVKLRVGETPCLTAPQTQILLVDLTVDLVVIKTIIIIVFQKVHPEVLESL